ncbi:MAG: CYTH domain-containing protein [Myxococcota bacterium]
MGTEIERKFLVPGPFPLPSDGQTIRQGYLSRDPDRTVRIRRIGDQARLTIKGRKVGAAAPEFEYPIPVQDADEMLDRLCEPGRIDKIRYLVPFAGFTWEVDVFSGENEGLVVAEIELERRGQEFERPAWVGEDVTEDPRYLNSNLSRTPYTKWER